MAVRAYGCSAGEIDAVSLLGQGSLRNRVGPYSIASQPSPLLEREESVERLSELTRAAAGGQGAIVSILGRPGEGKTTLLAAARTLAGEHGLRVCRARGSELERDFAFGVVRQLLEPEIVALAPEDQTALFEGAAIRRSGQRAASREPLTSGLDIAVAGGAVRLVERARVELAASGARPRRLRVSGRDSLTPSELRVACQAAEGHSNREIAQALLVTTKTVEMHLSNAYRKLDIDSREKLPSALDTDDPSLVPAQSGPT